MSDDIRLVVNDKKNNHSSESPTIIYNYDDYELLNEIKYEEKIMDQNEKRLLELAKTEKPLTKIQRVPEIMLQQYQKFGEFNKPRELSIGPIHADSNNLMKRELKIKLVARFVKKSGKTSEALLGQIKTNVDELRKSFDERVIQSYNNERLSRLLFLDGCSMLQFVTSYFSDHFLEEFKITNGEAALIQHDLLLAENQIPFLVLKLLMNSCDESFQQMLKRSVMRFVLMNAPIGFGYSKKPRYIFSLINLIDAQDRVHLLDLLRVVLLYDDQNIGEDNEDQPDSVSCDCIFQSRDQGCFSPCFRRIKHSFGHNTIFRKMGRDNEPYPKWSFRNVQELKLAGIKLKPSASCSLKAISFTTKCFIAGDTTVKN